uniref:Golgin A7 family, member Ba n=1 Tax=Cyprinus carpio TaxID=7962 RepID=A0A8C2IL35_CYPCA
MSSAPRTATERTKLPYCHESFHNLQELRHSASLANKVFIQRDYTDGTAYRRVSRTLFEDTVKTLNNYYAEAEKIGGQSYLEGCLACLTVYLIFLCIETRYEKVLKKVSRYIQEQNEKVYAPRGLLITDPIERGMRVVSLQSLQTTVCVHEQMVRGSC